MHIYERERESSCARMEVNTWHRMGVEVRVDSPVFMIFQWV